MADTDHLYVRFASLEWKLGCHMAEWKAARELAYRMGKAGDELNQAHCDGVVRLLREHLEGNYPGSPDSSDGPAVSDDREPASVMDQLKYQLFLKVKADLIREVINQALKDTASVHWRVTDTGEQIVRVGDLLRWAEQAAKKMERDDA